MRSTVEFNRKLKRWEMVTWVNLGDGIQISSAVTPLDATSRRKAITEMNKVTVSLREMAHLDSDAFFVGTQLTGCPQPVQVE